MFWKNTLAQVVTKTLLGAALVIGANFGSAKAADHPFITVASTTSTQNSGLFSHILPIFESESGIQVRVVAVGTGQAIKLAKNGDADVLLVHHRPSEEAFVSEGFGVKRFDVMYNDFIVVGPSNDPAHIKGLATTADAFKAIAETKSSFVSRADDSGTHKKERGIWKAAGIDPTQASGTWYREAGAGMGATLNIAQGLGGYALSDRGTWISFKNKDGLGIAYEGDKALFNPYGVILVNPARHPHVKATEGQAFVDWLISDHGQKAIADYKLNGQQLFFPARKVVAEKAN